MSLNLAIIVQVFSFDGLYQVLQFEFCHIAVNKRRYSKKIKTNSIKVEALFCITAISQFKLRLFTTYMQKTAEIIDTTTSTKYYHEKTLILILIENLY